VESKASGANTLSGGVVVLAVASVVEVGADVDVARSPTRALRLLVAADEHAASSRPDATIAPVQRPKEHGVCFSVIVRSVRSVRCAAVRMDSTVRRRGAEHLRDSAFNVTSTYAETQRYVALCFLHCSFEAGEQPT
jgi:hypothetical protein